MIKKLPGNSHIESADMVEALLYAIVESTDEAIIYKTIEGKIKSWNPSAEAMFGYSEDEVLDKPFFDFFPEEELDHHAMMTQLLSGQKVSYCRHHYHQKNQTDMFLSIISSLLKDSEGSPIGIICLVRNITQQALYNNLMDEYKSIVTYSNDAIITKTLGGIVTSWNPAAEELFGYQASEMIGQSILRLFPENRKQEENLFIDSIKAGKQIEHYETERVCKQGNLINVSVTLSPIKDARGNITGVSSIARDITSQVLEHEKVWQEARFDQLTKLPNRSLFEQTLDNELSLIDEADIEMSLTVLFIDLDHFKHYNDTYGHDFGDEVIKHYSAVIQAACRSSDMIARQAGDEFVGILKGFFPQDKLEYFVKNILNQICKPQLIDHVDVTLTASIGIASYPDDGETRTELVRSADLAMYAAKGKGRNTYCFASKLQHEAG